MSSAFHIVLERPTINCHATELAKWGQRMSELHRITSNPNKCGGRPTIRGTRMRVVDILELLASGATREEILEDFPYIEAEDITAALEYAVVQSNHPVLRTA